jgi:endo-alpha-1,4-polygalactosaminidase (GH114 family)
VQYLAQQSAALNLAIGLKNAADIVKDVLPVMNYAVNEQCVEWSECATFQPFISAGKPVFHIEYPDDSSSKSKTTICQDTGSKGFSTVLKDMDLDATVQYCT